MTTPQADKTARQADQETLAAIGLGKQPKRRRFRTEAILVLLLVAVALLSVGVTFSPGEAKERLEALAAAAAGVAAGLGYLQWRAARHEVSFDTYYDKLDTANQKFDAWRVEALKEDPGALQSHLNTMFVFAELDNLEYVLEKLKLGYVRQELAERAVRNFRSRCADGTAFCDKALWAVGEREGLQKAQGYERTTREAVRHVVAGCKEARSRAAGA
jgi:hypothetical protein